MNQPFIASSFYTMTLSLCLGVSFVLGGCNHFTSNQEEEPTQPEVHLSEAYQLKKGSDTLPYVFYERTAYEHNPSEYSQSDSTKIRFKYPLIDSSAPALIRDSVNKHIKAILLEEATQYTTVEERLNGFLAEFKAHQLEMQDFGLPSSNWAFDMELLVLTNTPAILALKVNQFEFTGGAHANSWTSYKNYQVASGKELQLDDLFQANKREAWLPLARAAFWEAWQIQDSSQEKSIEESDTIDFVLPPNFSIGTQALHFYYNPYELETYALEEFSFILPYTDLFAFIDTTVLPLERY